MAVDAYEHGQCDGIGFVFTRDDPYTVIDLDDAKGDPIAIARHQKIVAEFDSYAELSPSGVGVHVIAKARLADGRRRDQVEIYPHDRFATFTGNIIHNVGIRDCQSLAEILYAQLASEKSATAGQQPDRSEVLTDQQIIELLLRDAALAATYNSEPANYTGDNSAADQSLCNALAARSGNRAQVERIWMASPRGQRDKTQRRADYRRRTIEAAFDRPEVATVNIDALRRLYSPSTDPEPTLTDAADLSPSEPPARQYAWGNYFPLGLATLFFMGGGGGKSLFLQQACTAIAAHRPLVGMIPMQATAIYISCEDDGVEQHRRQIPINRALNVDIAQHRGKLFLVSLVNHVGNELAKFDHQGRMTVTQRHEWLERTIKKTGAKFVVLDNVAHFFAGNENVRNQVAAFLGLVNKLAADTGAAIVVIGHPNKSGDVYSGSTAWPNQSREVVEMTIPDENDYERRQITRTKGNYARKGETVDFRYHNGAFVSPHEVSDLAANGQLKASLEDAAFLRCLAALTAQKRTCSPVKGSTYAPKLFAAMPESSGLPERVLAQAMQRLFSAGTILADQFLWKDSHYHAKHGIKLAESAAEMPGTPHPATPIRHPPAPHSQNPDFPPAPPPPGTPLYINMDGAAHEQPPHPQKDSSRNSGLGPQPYA